MLLIFVQNILAALTIIFAKTALEYSQPLFYISIRLFLSGFFLIIYRLFLKERILFNWRDWYLFAQVIVIQLCISYSLEAFAIPHLTTAQVCLLYNLSPLFAAFFSYMFFGEYMTKRKWLGLIVGLIGFMPLLMTPSYDQNAGGAGLLSIPGLAELIAVISNTYGYIILSYLVRKRNYTPLHITSLSLVIAGILMGVVSIFMESWNPSPFIEPSLFFSYLFLVVLVGNILSYNMYIVLLKHYTATFVAFAGSLFPLFGALFGWLFFREAITWSFFLTFIMVSIGLYIFYSAEEQQSSPKSL